MSAADFTPIPDDAASMRLTTAAEQLRYAATALSALAGLIDDDDRMLQPHIDRLECRATELMRTTRRLAQEMGVSQRWGLDILFAEPVAPTPVRQAPAYESVELEPIELLQPVTGSFPAIRPAQASLPAWAPQIVLPTPPLVSVSSADESTC